MELLTQTVDGSVYITDQEFERERKEVWKLFILYEKYRDNRILKGGEELAKILINQAIEYGAFYEAIKVCMFTPDKKDIYLEIGDKALEANNLEVAYLAYSQYADTGRMRKLMLKSIENNHVDDIGELITIKTRNKINKYFKEYVLMHDNNRKCKLQYTQSLNTIYNLKQKYKSLVLVTSETLAEGCLCKMMGMKVHVINNKTGEKGELNRKGDLVSFEERYKYEDEHVLVIVRDGYNPRDITRIKKELIKHKAKSVGLMITNMKYNDRKTQEKTIKKANKISTDVYHGQSYGYTNYPRLFDYVESNQWTKYF